MILAARSASARHELNARIELKAWLDSRNWTINLLRRAMYQIHAGTPSGTQSCKTRHHIEIAATSPPSAKAPLRYRSSGNRLQFTFYDQYLYSGLAASRVLASLVRTRAH